MSTCDIFYEKYDFNKCLLIMLYKMYCRSNSELISFFDTNQSVKFLLQVDNFNKQIFK